MTDNNTYKIFDHVADTFIYAGFESGFKSINSDNSYVISGLPSATFNFLYLSKNDGLLESVVNDNIPFICFPKKELESSFAEIAKSNNLIVADNVVAHRFDIDVNWKYTPSTEIEISKVTTEEELKLFDEVSSEAFVHHKGLVVEFFKHVIKGSDQLELFIAYSAGKAVGTAQISTVNNVAGIYWLSVLPEYRKKGIATLLTNFIIGQAKDKGFTSVVSQNFTASQSLFRKIGFNPYGALPLYVYPGK